MTSDALSLLLELARALPAVRMAVAHPCDAESLRGALDAREQGLIDPILIAPLAKLQAVAEASGQSLQGVHCIDVPHSHAAAEQAVQLARRGEVNALMKGSLHSDELLHAALSSAGGLRTERRVSHVFAMEVPAYPKPLFITDAAVNIEPDLLAKRDIVQNAIDLLHALGIVEPKVAILAAVETVNPAMRATIDAAALCKMADRGQISGGMLDGPLAFDNAISADAARSKGIRSPVAGLADILLVPDLEAGNMLAKQLQYLAGARAAGIVLGLKVPIVLTSRADNAEARMASCAIAKILAARRVVA
ncbi:bifunctional enoyl-CoA hydratase/phosphate acetyltransferase [Chitinimonas taiwanensis]|uniref:Phosphate acetyltransferase n=1 Tax=Chitinimonas taiwanensis DSM 18899 TaxID=1121279 RepID=A0A1K2HQA8_9NEIS|nr:bifunctional enoyl-CoA hydratase/phosphate acetyltransferase [Chitinimonas taiwanensis]SFZ78996.1 phosphate acetyltransferase [Chitinimonas taiwanensis DSM 18899]